MDLTTPRLLLRDWRPEEAPRLFDILRRLEVVEWLGDQGPQPMASEEEASDRIARYAVYNATRAPLGIWAVEVTDDARRATVAGTVLLAELPDGDGEVEIAWYLHPDAWGHGYATEAAAAVLDHAFAAGLPQIWALTHPGNDRSQSVCRKLGLRHLGRAVRWYAIPFEQYVVRAEEWLSRG